MAPTLWAAQPPRLFSRTSLPGDFAAAPATAWVYWPPRSPAFRAFTLKRRMAGNQEDHSVGRRRRHSARAQACKIAFGPDIAWRQTRF